MSEQVYLITGTELADFSKAKMKDALDWVVNSAAENPGLSAVELALHLKDNVDAAAPAVETWVYGKAVAAQELVEAPEEVELPADVVDEEIFEVSTPETDVDDAFTADEEGEVESFYAPTEEDELDSEELSGDEDFLTSVDGPVVDEVPNVDDYDNDYVDIDEEPVAVVEDEVTVEDSYNVIPEEQENEGLGELEDTEVYNFEGDADGSEDEGEPESVEVVPSSEEEQDDTTDVSNEYDYENFDSFNLTDSDEPEVTFETEDEASTFTVDENDTETSFVDFDVDAADETTETPEEEPVVEFEEEIVEEPEPSDEPLPIDVENAIINVINNADGNQVTIDQLREGLGSSFTEEQFGQGFWALEGNGTIRFDEGTGFISVVPFSERHATSAPEEAEPEVEEVEAEEEETDFFATPVVSRAKQYQGLFREAGELDK